MKAVIKGCGSKMACLHKRFLITLGIIIAVFSVCVFQKPVKAKEMPPQPKQTVVCGVTAEGEFLFGDVALPEAKDQIHGEKSHIVKYIVVERW